MRTSSRSSHASVPCRIEWRPSRWLAGACGALGVLGAASVLASEMPVWAAWPLATLAIAYGAWLARREWRRPVQQLAWPLGRPPLLGGVPLHDAVLAWRGPLAFLGWRDASGRRRQLCWWPDTLDRVARRELRLAAKRACTSRSGRAMAG
jgi:toxin CptA